MERRTKAPIIRAGGAALAVLCALVLLVPAAVAAAPISAKVSATLHAKPDPQTYCEDCIRFSGRVTSPKAVCRSKRELENALRYKAGSPNGGKTYRDDFTATDGQGRFDVVLSSGEPLAWFEVIVPRKRIGGVVCQAARAKVTL
jgi:hypothetical protein